MKIVISIQSDANSAVTFEIERTKTLTASTLGMALSESKQVLTQIQRIIVQSQIVEYSSAERTCPKCGAQRRIKDYRTVNFKSLFGTMPVKLPRLFGCCCEHANSGARILKIDGLKNWVAPELEYIQSHLASTVSYARASQFLSLLLPADKGSSVSTVRRRTLAVGERLEDELRHSANTEINHSANRSDTKSPFVMGLDSGYIRDCQPGTERSFEVVVGRILPDPAVSRSIGFVRTVENNKQVRHRLKNRVNQVGQNCDHATVMTDGDAGLRSLRLAVLPKATHILDWFHLTRHLTVINRVIEGSEVQRYRNVR